MSGEVGKTTLKTSGKDTEQTNFKVLQRARLTPRVIGTLVVKECTM